MDLLSAEHIVIIRLTKYISILVSKCKENPMHQITSDLNSVGKSNKGSNFTEIYILKSNLYFSHIFIILGRHI